jgi:2-keto-4-pentenoate hydratase
MLDKDQIVAASRTLHDHWRAGTKFDGLETSLRPRDRAEGYAIQAAIEKYSAARLFGWKIAATSEAGQKHINVDGPMAGRILTETVIPDGGKASMAGNEMRVGEPEFAFRMAADLPPRSAPYTVQEVLDAVDTLHPAIEIPDSRFADFVSAGAAQIIADNACAHLFVLGAPTASNWRALDLVEEKPVITLRGKPIHRPRQERAWRSPAGAGLARQRTASARRDAARRRDRDDGHLPPAAADSIG